MRIDAHIFPRDDVDPLTARLQRYRPRTDREVADVGRVLSLATTAEPWSRATPLHVTASALIVHVPTRRVLLRWHSRQQAWLQVGGHGDPGERDPLDIALREGREETGLADLTPWPDDAIVHVAIVPVPPARDEPAHEHADVRFVLATDRPDDAMPEDQAGALRWLASREALGMTTEENVRETIARATALLDAAAR